MPEPRGSGALSALISSWREGRGPGQHFTAIKHTSAIAPVYGKWPEALNPRLADMMRARGFEKLYSHQASSITHALNGDDVVIVTPTASGKSLCYNLPVLDSLYWGGNALYLFPTKALSQDQCAELNDLLDKTPGRESNWEAQVYDGDTPPDVRKRIRKNSRLVVTNPDMLHAAILPHHKRWAAFFQKLEYIVVDELHTYRGVFGSHVANVMRRLLRICAHYGATPTFLCTSATIANPQQLAEQLTGRGGFALVNKSGAPQTPRTLCFFNPPITDKLQMRRQSALTAAARITRATLERELGTIIFARSRQSVEILVHRLKEQLARTHGQGRLEDRVASYRGGYLPDLRRSIERGLRNGKLLGVISTNALELGIDIGQLDVCVMAGYPGTIASTWQQIGRAGRRGSESLSIFIATDSPLDQFMVNNPDYFFAQPPEHARIDPDNLRVVAEHLKCACYELPWLDGEGFGLFEGDAVREMFEFLEAETRMVGLVNGRWRWSDRHYPASEVNLRNIADENFVVIDQTQKVERVLAEVDFESAHTSIYPNAVYQVYGKPYRVERLDYDARRAYVVRSEDGYYTTAISYRAVNVIESFGEGMIGDASVGYGEVCVTERFVGYKKIKFGTGENVGYGELNLPELDLHTMSYWVTLASKRFERFSRDATRWARIVHGIGQVLQTAASLKLMCDPRDIALCCGSVAEDEWLSQGFEGLQVRSQDGSLHTFGMSHDPQADHHAMQSGRVGPELYNPTLFIYDRFPGGVGFGEGLYEQHLGFVELARDLVSSCACEQGCPSCVGPVMPGDVPCKADVVALLAQLGVPSSDEP